MRVIIAKSNYEKNIRGGRTLFSPMGFALGDNVVFEVVRRYYKSQNPDEEIIFSNNPIEYENEYNSGTYDKVFHAEETNFMLAPEWAYHYSVFDEATALAEMGFYPELEYEPVKPEVFNEDMNIFTWSFRNTKLRPSKNVTQDEFKLLSNIFGDYKSVTNIIVGNDNYLPFESFPDDFIDLRNRLILPEIAWLLKFSIRCVTKDSGIGHLAAAAGCKKIISWGFADKKYWPKTRGELINLGVIKNE